MISGTKRMEWMKTLAAANGKVKVECEKELAEFMEDVNRIVQCNAEVRLQNKSLEASSEGVELLLEGLCCFSVVYRCNSRGAEGELCGEEFVSEFEYRAELPVSEAYDPDLLWDITEISADSVVCRPLGPRKLQLRCELGVSSTVKGNVLVDMAEDGGDQALETNVAQWNASVMTGKSGKEIRLNHQFSIPSEYPPIERLLDRELKIFCEAVQVSEKGISFRSRAWIACCYRSTEGDGSPVSFVLPLESTHLLECREQTGQNAWVETYPVDFSLEVKETEAGEKRNLDLSLAFLAEGMIYESRPMECTEDCYSTSRELEVTREQFVSEEVRYWELCDARGELLVPPKEEDLARVEMIRSDLTVEQCVAEAQGFKVTGKLKLSMLGVKTDGTTVIIKEEKETELSFRPERGTELVREKQELHLEFTARVKEVECQLEEGQLHLQVLARASLMLVDQKPRMRVCSVSPKGDLDSSAGKVIFYYPEKEESPWEIGKRFHVSMEKVEGEMGKEGGKLPRVLMLVP